MRFLSLRQIAKDRRTGPNWYLYKRLQISGTNSAGSERSFYKTREVIENKRASAYVNMQSTNEVESERQVYNVMDMLKYNLE